MSFNLQGYIMLVLNMIAVISELIQLVYPIYLLTNPAISRQKTSSVNKLSFATLPHNL